MSSEWPREPGVRVLPAASATAWQDAHSLLIAAERELAQAQQAHATLSQDAWRRGYDKGLREGRDEIARLLLHTRKQLDCKLRELEPQLLGLITRVLRKLLGETLDTRTVERLVRTGMHKLPANEPLTLWVAPEHAMALARDGKGLHIAVQADPSLNPAQALLVSQGHSVDLSPEYQVAERVPTRAPVGRASGVRYRDVPGSRKPACSAQGGQRNEIARLSMNGFSIYSEEPWTVTFRCRTN